MDIKIDLCFALAILLLIISIPISVLWFNDYNQKIEEGAMINNAIKFKKTIQSSSAQKNTMMYHLTNGDPQTITHLLKNSSVIVDNIKSLTGHPSKRSGDGIFDKRLEIWGESQDKRYIGFTIRAGVFSGRYPYLPIYVLDTHNLTKGFQRIENIGISPDAAHHSVSPDRSRIIGVKKERMFPEYTKMQTSPPNDATLMLFDLNDLRTREVVRVTQEQTVLVHFSDTDGNFYTTWHTNDLMELFYWNKKDLQDPRILTRALRLFDPPEQSEKRVEIMKIDQLIFSQVVDINNLPEKTAKKTDASDTTNWNTYHNKELGFTIKYPLDWIEIPQQNSPNEETISVIGFGEKILRSPADPEYAHIYVTYIDNPTNQGLKSYYEKLAIEFNHELDTSPLKNFYSITSHVTGTDAQEAILFPLLPGPISNTRTSFRYNNVILEVDKHNDHIPSDHIYDLMIQTIRFD